MDGDALLLVTEPVQGVEEQVLVASGDPGVGIVIGNTGGADPYQAAFQSVIQGFGGLGSQSEGTGNVSILFFVGGELVARQLGVGPGGGGQQGCGGDILRLVRGYGQALGHGKHTVVVAVNEGICNGVGLHVRHQIVGGRQGVVVAVALQDNAGVGGNAVGGKQSLQLLRGLLFGRLGDIEKVAAVFQIGGQNIDLLLGKVRIRGIDEQGTGILGNGFHRQKGEGFGFQVGLADGIGELGAQSRLSVAGGQIDQGQAVAGHIGNGPGEDLLPGELSCILAGGIVAGGVIGVDVIIAQIPIPLGRNHHQRVVVGLRHIILAQKIRIHIRVPAHHLQLRAPAFVLGKELLNVGILLPSLDHPVDRDVLLKRGHQIFTLGGQGKELLLGHVLLGKAFGQSARQQVHGNGNGYGQGTDQQAVAPSPEGPAAETGKIRLFHSLHRLFSRI